MILSETLSIIVVAYYSTDLLRQCIKSVLQNSGSLTVEIIIVCNGFEVDEKEIVKKEFPSIQWIDMPDNAGFARANNAGMRQAKGDLFLLLNPDTIVIDPSISICAQRLSNSVYAAAGVQLLDIHQTPQISGSYFVKGGLNHLLPIPYWGDFIRWLGYRLKSKVPGVQQAKSVEEVDWISGAFLMVKRSAVEKAGMMDEDFFLYGEEVEWCSRLKKIGRLAIFGDLKIVHLEGATINKNQNLEEKGYYNLYDKKGLQLMVSNHLRVRKQYGPGWFLILLVNYTFGLFVFALAGALHQTFTLRNPFAHLPRVYKFGKNLVSLWKLAPTIISNKPHFYKMF